MTEAERRQFLEGMEEDHIRGRNLKEELQGIIDLIPGYCYVKVREGGGPENLLASIAVSVAKMKRELE